MKINYAIPGIWCGPHAPGVALPLGRVTVIKGGKYYGCTISLTPAGEPYIVSIPQYTGAVLVRERCRVGDIITDLDIDSLWACWFVAEGDLPAPTNRRIVHPGYTRGERAFSRECEGRLKWEADQDRLWVTSQEGGD